MRRVSMSVTSNSSHLAWDTQVTAAWAGSYSNLRQTQFWKAVRHARVCYLPVGIFSSVYIFITGYHVNLDRFNFFLTFFFVFLFTKKASVVSCFVKFSFQWTVSLLFNSNPSAPPSECVTAQLQHVPLSLLCWATRRNTAAACPESSPLSELTLTN